MSFLVFEPQPRIFQQMKGDDSVNTVAAPVIQLFRIYFFPVEGVVLPLNTLAKASKSETPS